MSQSQSHHLVQKMSRIAFYGDVNEPQKELECQKNIQLIYGPESVLMAVHLRSRGAPNQPSHAELTSSSAAQRTISQSPNPPLSQCDQRVTADTSELPHMVPLAGLMLSAAAAVVLTEERELESLESTKADKSSPANTQGNQ